MSLKQSRKKIEKSKKLSSVADSPIDADIGCCLSTKIGGGDTEHDGFFVAPSAHHVPVTHFRLRFRTGYRQSKAPCAQLLHVELIDNGSFISGYYVHSGCRSALSRVDKIGFNDVAGIDGDWKVAGRCCRIMCACFGQPFGRYLHVSRNAHSLRFLDLFLRRTLRKCT